MLKTIPWLIHFKQTWTCTKWKNYCILSNFMKSWLNKVPLFFWYHAYLTLFWVPHFVPLPNLQINLSLKDLVLRIQKLPKIIHPTTQETESRRKSHVPGLKTWRFKNWYVQTAVFFSAQKIRPIWRASNTSYGFWQKKILDWVTTVT